MKKLFLPILILFVFNTILNAQLKVKDQDSTPHTLMQVNDEGIAGSITLGQLTTIGTPASKLYNLGGVLHWAGSPLATGGSSPWTINGSNIYYNTGNVGIGTTSPAAKLSVGGNGNSNIAIYGKSSLTTGIGVYGYASSTSTDTHYGGYFYAAGLHGCGVYGEASASSGYGVYGQSYGSSGYGVYGSANGASAFAGYFFGRGYFSGHVGIGTEDPSGPLHIKMNGTAIADGIRLATSLTSGEDWYFYMDENDDLRIANDASPYVTFQKNTGNVGIGTYAPESKLSVGSDGYSNTTIFGANHSESGRGVYGAVDGNNAEGVFGYAYGSSSSAIYGWSAGGGSYAGYFSGSVNVTGTLSKGGGSFKIDHPLDPTNKNLYHSFVESPDMMNIYNGNIVTNGNNEAVVELPDWFEPLNKDFRYQLTVIGEFAQAIIKEKINNNQFTIMTDKPNIEVSWQVTGIRHDAFANANRIQVEEYKKEKNRGKYLHPEAFGLPHEMSVDYDQKLEPERKLMNGER